MQYQQCLPRLLAISSGREHLDARGLVRLQAEALVTCRPVLYQLREKGLDSRMLQAIALDIAPLFRRSGSRLLINERFDIALASNADGVHLPEASCPPEIVRKTVPRSLIAGQSVHSPEKGVRGWKSGLDYLLFGPVFETPSKAPYGPPQGLDRLEEICRSVPVPVYALGGITPEKAAACIERGAWGVAALTPFLDPGHLPETVERFQAYLPT